MNGMPFIEDCLLSVYPALDLRLLHVQVDRRSSFIFKVEACLLVSYLVNAGLVKFVTHIDHLRKEEAMHPL
jgi:hypothetical protein